MNEPARERAVRKVSPSRAPSKPLRAEEFAVGQSAATVPKSYPGTEMRGIGEPMVFSIERTIAISSGDMKVNASPVVAARPVRPMRCI